MTTPLQPLRGIRVLDLSRHLPGPFLTSILRDLGAEVYKVEPPHGDPTRFFPPLVNEMGAIFAALNGGKQSMALDVRPQEGKALLHAMVRQVDVLVDSFRPGVLDRMGLTGERLEELNPRLIAVSITGYGHSGPLKRRAGHDLNYLARAGLLAGGGPPQSPPPNPAFQAADVGGGSMPAAIGVLAALLERSQTGKGRRLDVAMARSVIPLGTVAHAVAAAGGEEAQGQGMLSGGLAGYRCYRCSDGRYLAVGALEPHFLAQFCEKLGVPEAGMLLPPGPANDVPASKIAEALAAQPLDHWLSVLGDDDVCAEPVATLAETRNAQPDVLPVVDGAHAVQLHVGVPPTPPGPARPLNADAHAICEALEIDEDVVAAAVAAGAL